MQVLMPRMLYGGHQPSAPVASGNRPIQPQAPIVPMSVNPMSASPTTIRYPIERMLAKHGLDYFTSTVALELAWVIDHIDRAVAAQVGDGATLERLREARRLKREARRLETRLAGPRLVGPFRARGRRKP